MQNKLKNRKQTSNSIEKNETIVNSGDDLHCNIDIEEK